MYDIIRYIKKHNKLDYKIATTLTDLDAELNEGKVSGSFDKRLEKVHKMQLDYINVCQIMVEFLSQDEDYLHMKRVRLRILNILIAAIPIILSFSYVGVYKIISLVLATLILGGDFIGNKALNDIIKYKEETIEIIADGIELRDKELKKLRDKYADFISKETLKIIKENNIDIDNDKKAPEKVINILKAKNIGCVKELNFFKEKKENILHNNDKNEYVFSIDDTKEETYDGELTPDKTKVKKRIKRDGDK